MMRSETDVERFVLAQKDVYARALAELMAGKKQTHWIWFIFPNWKSLGRSSMSQQYAIGSVAEAKAYLDHPVLGPRLLECTNALLGQQTRTAHEILGYPDDLKVQSSMTLFASISAGHSVFHDVIDRYFDGKMDEKTIALMATGSGR